MKKLILISLILFSNLAFATIYSYTAKDGKIYYISNRPTGLTDIETIRFKLVSTDQVDALNKVNPLPIHHRETVKNIMKADYYVPPSFLPVVDISKQPAPNVGYSDLRIKPTTIATTWNNTRTTGEFRLPCDFSHMNNDDPIIYPGLKGAAHHHTYFGNTSVNYLTTSKSLLTTGNSTCAGGIMNRSAYWVPSVIDTATNAPVKPFSIMVYYKIESKGQTNVVPLPEGLRMIAGNQKATNANEAYSGLRYTCNQDYATRSKSIPVCAKGATLDIMLPFPNCWDGKNLDSPDHKSHVSYPSGTLPREQNTCPSTHPYKFPSITYNIAYRPDTDAGSAKWRLASDNYNGPAGYSYHGDYMNGWDKKFSDTWLNSCLLANKDCHAYLLGDGTMAY